MDFVIDDTSPFSEVTKGLREYLVENRGLWSRGSIGVNAGRRMLSQQQLSHIKQIIETESGLTVARFWCSPETVEIPDILLEEVEPLPPPVKRLTNSVESPNLGSNGNGHEPADDSAPRGIRWTGSHKGEPVEALFVKSTFRSGESIRYPGDVIVMADVNPGAEIQADGDIVVLGNLRGFAHAGASGDTKAAIIALEFNSPRIQIGPYVGLAPAETKRTSSSANAPEIAYVRRRSILVASFAGRFARYTKGVLYDG